MSVEQNSAARGSRQEHCPRHDLSGRDEIEFRHGRGQLHSRVRKLDYDHWFLRKRLEDVGDRTVAVKKDPLNDTQVRLPVRE